MITADCITINLYDGKEHQIEGVEITSLDELIANIQDEYDDASSVIIIVTLPKAD